MEPTLLIGDHILAPGGERIGDLRRGDVIVFHLPPDPSVVLVKRLIGLPGDHLRISNGALIVNSKTMAEPYVQHLAGRNVSAYLNDFPLHAAGEEKLILPDGRKMLEQYATSGELIIPAGGYFVLGDSRDNSYDSRVWGLVAPSQIIGLAQEIVSSDDPGTKMARADRVHILVKRGSLPASSEHGVAR